METSDKKQIRISGIIKNYLSNKHGDIASFELATDKESFKINFPPHAAKVIMERAGQGSFIDAFYEQEKPKHDPEGDKKPKLKLLSIAGIPGGELLIEGVKPQKINEAPLVETLSFTDFDLLRGKKGELVGIKSGKNLVHVHKEDQALNEIIKPHAQLEITAVKRTDEGFVNQEQDNVYHIQKLTLEGQEYISKKQ